MLRTEKMQMLWEVYTREIIKLLIEKCGFQYLYCTNYICLGSVCGIITNVLDCRGVRPSSIKVCPIYDTKQSDGEGPVREL